VNQFAQAVRDGEIKNPAGETFRRALIIGIGGSALGPQLLDDALTDGERGLSLSFFDNTDPEGMERVLRGLRDDLRRTLFVIISKSGGTPETRNGMIVAAEQCRRAGIDFVRNAVAITGEGSALAKKATEENWLKVFPMWDWVGGRTSVCSAVGLLPAALAGVNIEEFLDGARRMDQATRRREMRQNPAALLALMWYWAGDGAGRRDMVILPYKDRLILFSRYLQQLVMESLGKEKDLDGKVVHQGIAVYGNKGSTDQHAYVQQLREGVDNFFVTFIEVLKDGDGTALEVEPGITCGDYLEGFYLGTREALSERGRDSMTITLSDLTPRGLGALVALFERAVGLYALLVNVNAYHQPGVEAGKKAAAHVLELQLALRAALETTPNFVGTAEVWAANIGRPSEVEIVYKVLERLVANRPGLVRRIASDEAGQIQFASSQRVPASNQ
jgi:glucose-6-phosphate isomerase